MKNILEVGRVKNFYISYSLFDILHLKPKKNISTIQYGRNKIDEGK
jgi:hypothetical protein